jgi:RNA polymerase sigma factor (sigma-70 family)
MEPERLEELWQRWLKDHAASDREHLIVHYRPLVDRCLNNLTWHRYSLERLDREDLRSDGTIGLMGAIKAFRPEKHPCGVAGFKGFAWNRITGAMIDGLRQSGATMGRGRSAGAFNPLRVIRLTSDVLEGLDKDSLSEEVDPSDDMGIIDTKVDLVRGLMDLSQSDRDLLVDYYFKGETLVALGKRIGLTDSRVCQKVKLARERLKRRLVA